MKIKVLLPLVFFFTSCVQNSHKPDPVLTYMSYFNKSDVPKEYQDLLINIETLKMGMITYMNEADPGYTDQDVNQCVIILQSCILEIAKSNSKKDGIEIIKSKIQELNELNKKCGDQLIETGEREEIAEIIISAGYKKGYNQKDEDVTEEWREW